MKFLPFVFIFLSACSISRPCSEGGDVTWNPKIIGDKRCEQKELKDGRVVNHGAFNQIYQSTGKVAIEGMFNEGRKSGIWTYYGEDGNIRTIKYFDQGVEKTPPADVQKKIDLIIQQKAGSNLVPKH